MNIGTGASAFIRRPTSTTAWPATPPGNAPRPWRRPVCGTPPGSRTTHDPKILELPAAAWINQPPDHEEPAA